MKERLRKIGRGIKKFVNEKVETCKEILSSAQNRLILGWMIMGIGVGLGVGLGGSLVISAYVHAPE